MSADPYVLFVASAYGASALALGGLGLWAFLDARSVRRRLDRLEAARPARRGGGAAS